VQVPYEGKPLQSGQKYSWQVRVWDNSGKASSWNDPAYFQTSFLIWAEQYGMLIQDLYCKITTITNQPKFQSRNLGLITLKLNFFC